MLHYYHHPVAILTRRSARYSCHCFGSVLTPGFTLHSLCCRFDQWRKNEEEKGDFGLNSVAFQWSHDRKHKTDQVQRIWLKQNICRFHKNIFLILICSNVFPRADTLLIH